MHLARLRMPFSRRRFMMCEAISLVEASEMSGQCAFTIAACSIISLRRVRQLATARCDILGPIIGQVLLRVYQGNTGPTPAGVSLLLVSSILTGCWSRDGRGSLQHKQAPRSGAHSPHTHQKVGWQRASDAGHVGARMCLLTPNSGHRCRLAQIGQVEHDFAQVPGMAVVRCDSTSGIAVAGRTGVGQPCPGGARGVGA